VTHCEVSEQSRLWGTQKPSMHLAPAPPHSESALHALARDPSETGDASEEIAAMGASERNTESGVDAASDAPMASRTFGPVDASDAPAEVSGAALQLASARAESLVASTSCPASLDTALPASDALAVPASAPSPLTGTHWACPPASLQMKPLGQPELQSPASGAATQEFPLQT